MKSEPVTLAGAATAALLATTAVLAFIFDWSGELVALVNGALAAWVIVVAMVVRSFVSPTRKLPPPPPPAPPTSEGTR